MNLLNRYDNVINKSIITGNGILTDKTLDDNIKFSIINNVNKENLDTYLSKIIEENPKVIFDTFQYIESTKQLYIYSNSLISTKELKKIKKEITTPDDNKRRILEDLRKIMTQDKNNDPNCISLYSIAKLVKRKRLEYEILKQIYIKKCNIELRKYFGKNSGLLIYDFDFKKKTIKIQFKLNNERKQIIFKKFDDDLFIKESETTHSSEILYLIGNYISELYDKFLTFNDFYNQDVYNIRSINSHFLIDIDCYKVSMHTNLSKTENFELYYINTFKYDCNSNNLIKVFKDNEEDIFKNIYVNIEDCPAWSRELLYAERQKEFRDEEKYQREQIYQEVKQEKISELTKKIQFTKNKILKGRQ